MPLRPQEKLPFLVTIDAKNAKKRFTLTLAKTESGLHLTAFPKLNGDKARYDKVEVIIDEETYLTSAIQVHRNQGWNKTTYILDETKVNLVPADRDTLIEPDLKHFQVDGG